VIYFEFIFVSMFQGEKDSNYYPAIFTRRIIWRLEHWGTNYHWYLITLMTLSSVQLSF